MSFPNKLTEIMQKRNITAQDISKQSYHQISINDIGCFKKGIKLPKPNQVRLLNHIFGVDFELILNPSPKRIRPKSQLGISISEFGKAEKIMKPGDKIKPTKIKNKSKTRLHDIKLPDKKHCRNCDRETGTERFCHAESTEIKALSGSGIIGGKIDDNLTAFLCSDCDIKLSTKPNKEASYIEHTIHANLWYKAILKTHLL